MDFSYLIIIVVKWIKRWVLLAQWTWKSSLLSHSLPSDDSKYRWLKTTRPRPRLSVFYALRCACCVLCVPGCRCRVRVCVWMKCLPEWERERVSRCGLSYADFTSECLPERRASSTVGRDSNAAIPIQGFPLNSQCPVVLARLSVRGGIIAVALLSRSHLRGYYRRWLGEERRGCSRDERWAR